MELYENIKLLLFKHFRQELTTEEAAELNAWLQQSPKNQQFFDRFTNIPDLLVRLRELDERDKIDVKEKWVKMQAFGWELPVGIDQKVVRIKWWRYVAAAVIVLFASYGIYQLVQQPAKSPPNAPVIVKAVPSDAKPKISNAILTLDNGETIILDSIKSGLLAMQGTMKIEKQSNGVLRYSGDGTGSPEKLIYNKVTVPKGSDVVYLQLSDGSKVWLNAASSIRYPVSFSDQERKVEITGEAYFEITKAVTNGTNQRKSFIVSKGNMNVTVLGTKFNVNSYENEENIKVTLLEGSVQVQSKIHDQQSKVIIKPGEQAVIDDKDLKVINGVNINQVMAWKEGKFVFKKTNIQLIMRQMERWYDLDPTQFEGEAVRQFGFNGEISRYSNASKVIELLEKTGTAKFKVEGKKIVVSQQ